MSPANARPAPRKSAKHSRRPGSRARAARSISPLWRRPLRRARRAIAACVDLIECSRRIVETSEESRSLRPTQTTLALKKASGWIADASVRLSTVVRSLNEASVCAARAPEQAAALPDRMLFLTVQYLGVAAELLATSDRLEATFAELLLSAQEGTLLPDPSLYRRPTPAAPRILFARPLAPQWPSCEQIPVITIHVRRRRTAPRTIAEPSKRVSRGRAPPSFSSAFQQTAV